MSLLGRKAVPDVIGYGALPSVEMLDRCLRLALSGRVRRDEGLIDRLLICRHYAAIVEGRILA